VRPYRRQLFVTEPFDLLPRDAPMMVDYATGWYFRPEGDAF
jgi:glycine/D-amino acid oxidase-like deaminating enzyme